MLATPTRSTAKLKPAKLTAKVGLGEIKCTRSSKSDKVRITVFVNHFFNLLCSELQRWLSPAVWYDTAAHESLSMLQRTHKHFTCLFWFSHEKGENISFCEFHSKRQLVHITHFKYSELRKDDTIKQTYSTCWPAATQHFFKNHHNDNML